MFSNHRIVPVIMFHSVGLENSDWIFSYLSESVHIFEEKIMLLKRQGYNFIFWQDLYDYMSCKKKLPTKSIMLTFDDGYLDNWVYVFPILKKYEAKITIFINPEFVDPGSQVRLTTDDVKSGSIPLDKLQTKGFLNWEELRAMQKSGLVDIQSHALTHTWYFSSLKLIDFHRPKLKKYPWMAWNLRKDRKPFYMLEDQSRFVPVGMPIYQYEKSLVCRRVFPSNELIDDFLKEIERLGGIKFFKEKNWKREIKNIYDYFFSKYKNRFSIESEEQYSNRIHKEVNESKNIISEQLCKPIDFICWPGGGYNNTVLKIAKDVGYKAWTLSSKDQSNFKNVPGANPQHIKRIGASKYFQFKGNKFGLADGKYFVNVIERHKGSILCKLTGRIMLLNAMIRNKLGLQTL